MTDWANDLSEDYHAAAVRLVKLTENRIQHLLFASIELHPHEIPPPPPAIEPQRKNFGEATLRVSLVVMSVRDALNWYQSVLSGSMKVPGLSQEVAVTTARFSPEPILGRLLISNELPFALTWHGGLRIHRLIPMEDLPETVADLISAKESEKQTTIRTWLDDRLGFDLLAYDDFLGGVVLLAPNPVVRGVGTYIKEILPGGRERLGVKAAVRQGVDPNGAPGTIRTSDPQIRSLVVKRHKRSVMQAKLPFLIRRQAFVRQLRFLPSTERAFVASTVAKDKRFV